jgi:hypothetical protein
VSSHFYKFQTCSTGPKEGQFEEDLDSYEWSRVLSIHERQDVIEKRFTKD